MKSTAIIVQHGICVGMRKSLKFLTAQFNNIIAVEESNVKSRRADEMYDDYASGATDQAKGRLEFAKELQGHIDTAVRELMKEQKYLTTLKKEYEAFHDKEALDSVMKRIHESGLERSKRYEEENKAHKKIVKSLSEIAMVLTGQRFKDSLKEYLQKDITDEQKSEVRNFLRKCRDLQNEKSRASYDTVKELNETQIFAKLSTTNQSQILQLGNDFIELISNIIEEDDKKMNNFITIINLNIQKL